jgi:hypothetical protein
MRPDFGDHADGGNETARMTINVPSQKCGDQK